VERLSIADEFKVVMDNETKRHANDNEFIKMQQLMADLEKKGLLKKSTYTIPQNDTKDKWIVQVNSNVTRTN